MRALKIGLVSAFLVCFGWSAALAAEITVSAAASLADAFTEIKGAFEAAHPGVTVRTNFAASNPLLRQIQEGAPVAVFASADQKTMDQAKDFVVPDSRRDFARGTLVLITPSDAAIVNSVADLSTAAVKRLAVGNPDSVPAGRYAREALGDTWAALGDKMIFGNNVRQVLEYVARGEVDAGIVYGSDAQAQNAKSAKNSHVRVAAELTGHTPVVYPMALIQPAQPEAQKFMDFVMGEKGRSILQRHGFVPLP